MSMIYGGRLRLRATERDDLKHYYEWVNDPEVTRGLSMYLPMSTRDEEKWFEAQLEKEAVKRPLAVELRQGLLERGEVERTAAFVRRGVVLALDLFAVHDNL